MPGYQVEESIPLEAGRIKPMYLQPGKKTCRRTVGTAGNLVRVGFCILRGNK